MKRRTKITTSVLAAMAVSVGGVAVAQSDTSTTTTSGTTVTTAPSNAAPKKTSTKIERRTLKEEDRYDGILTYRDQRKLTAPGAAGTGGSSRTVTTIADAGSTLKRGDIAYSLDAQPTVMMYGDMPMYRALSTNSSDGDDVRQLEQNLVALGYDSDGKIVVDETYDSRTADAVKAWEEDLGITADGTVDQSEVVFLPGESVVSDATAGVGESANSGSSLIDVVVIGEVKTVTSPLSGEISNVTADQQSGAGSVLYDRDDVAVVTLIGDEPITRKLSKGDSGKDVELLQQNLVSLGHDAVGVTGDFDEATKTAVEEMQFDAGQKVDGTVDRGDVAVIPDGYTITSRFDTTTETDGSIAVTANDELFAFGRTDRVVTVDLQLDDQSKMSVGAKVRIAIDGVDDAAGTVRSVASVATDKVAGGTAADDSTVTVTIALDTAVDIPQVETPVDVYVERILADNTLVVPVAALVALAEGGYAIEIANGTGTTLIPVTPGEYADNFVEISGDGVTEGVEVVVAS
jgi:peptidoglycan hydrolase-like protein with peptidoglycan-binding domain